MDCVLHESFTSSQRTALPNQQAAFKQHVQRSRNNP